MSIPSFIESIKVSDGKFCNLQAHIERMRSTMEFFYGIASIPGISDLHVPQTMQNGLFKCRILYASDILSVDFEPYRFREIKSLKVVVCNEIDYAFKSSDRSHLEALRAMRGEADDIVIVKNGRVTDASFSNLVFECSEGLFTPNTCLLNGTKRRRLLAKGVIGERDICVSDIVHYSRVYLVNAMINIEDAVSVSVSNILF